MLPVNDPGFQLLKMAFSKDVIDGFFYLMDRLDQKDREYRYEDNRKRFLEQALRLFEQGELTKDQLKAVVDLLPETKTVKAVQLPNIPQGNGQPLDLEAILRKLEQ